MKLKLELRNKFHCPEGKWRGQCEYIDEPKKLIKHMGTEQVRIRFSVDTDDGEKLVARTFSSELHPGTELYGFLYSWLGEDLIGLVDEEGEIDLDLLIGEQADLSIVHGKKTAEYSYPVVLINGIYPPGRLIRE